MTVEKRIEELEKRISDLEKLEKAFCRTGLSEVIGLDLILPEADIGSLHFNETKVHGVFDLKEDGNYYSRDILFLSARDTDKDTWCDLLSEYLDSEAVRDVFRRALGDEVRVFLPEENQGIKKYNGVTCWYWLRSCVSNPATHFASVGNSGFTYYYYASAVGGCAPAFRVGREETP
jgi:hypothetical protein